MRMKRVIVLLTGLALTAATASAQAVYSGSERRFSLAVGAMGSVYQPQIYLGIPNDGVDGLGHSQKDFGPGAFVDVGLRRWIQLEGEVRWMRFSNKSAIQGPSGIGQDSEDNYLVGPRILLHRFGKATPYAKILLGAGVFPHANLLTVNVNQSPPYAVLAYGGGVDYKLSKKISLRALDFELQQWMGIEDPNGNKGTTLPYGASAGIIYKIF